MKRMPTIFIGHGSPMMALEHTAITETFKHMGEEILREFSKPKAILAISAHWYTKGTFVQSAKAPKQIYDMYGFPQELYDVKYPAQGDRALTDMVLNTLGSDVSINDNWGIDHGTWTILVHLFPKADIPVVQLSVNANLTAAESFELGRRLQGLRDEGYLIIGSGNVVHNLGAIEYDNPDGTPASDRFDSYVRDAIVTDDIAKVLAYKAHQDSAYAVPTPEHFLPLPYILGTAYEGEKPLVFNDVRQIGAISMTGYAYGLPVAQA